jgi:hypothetical protein
MTYKSMPPEPRMGYSNSAVFKEQATDLSFFIFWGIISSSARNSISPLHENKNVRWKFFD